MSQKQYNKGRIPQLVVAITTLIKRNPSMLDNLDYLMTNLYEVFPPLKNKEYCANCDASMIEYVFEFDILDAVLLVAMGDEVRRRKEKMRTSAFVEINQIRVHSLPVSYSIKSRTTQMSKLGLIAQLRGANNKRVPGIWVITKRGFAALKGEAVPADVPVFRNEIQDSRSGKMITLAEAFKLHRDKVESAILRHKNPRSDYRQIIDQYHPEEWVGYGDLHQGAML